MGEREFLVEGQKLSGRGSGEPRMMREPVRGLSRLGAAGISAGCHCTVGCPRAWGMMNRIQVEYREARRWIASGDLLLFRRRSLIAIAGRSEYSHAAMTAWWDLDLFCLEVREWYGGRAVTLSSQVEKHPGRIDVFEVNPDLRWPAYSRRGAVRYMRRLAGCPYGYGGIALAAMFHLPVFRLFARAELDDTATSRFPPFCSQAVAAADRIGGGVDPVPHLPDYLVEPADLARSPFYRYRFTLQP